MSARLRLWLRRHSWFWLSFAVALGLGSVVMAAFVVLAGYRPSHLALAIWAAIPLADAYIVWYLAFEAEVFRKLLSSQLREDVPAQQPR